MALIGIVLIVLASTTPIANGIERGLSGSAQIFSGIRLDLPNPLNPRSTPFA
ncbi:MAG: hypothetical protein R2856_40175 [Caldilineaceae bacterium]